MKSTYQNKDWDSLSAAAKAEVAKVAIQKGIYSLDGIKNMYNEFAMGGDTSNTVPLGRRYWQAQSNAPTILEKKNTWVKQQKAIKDRKDKALSKWLKTEGVKELNKEVKDYLTTSNDNTWTAANRHPKNPHLQDRVTKGAKAHASWEKEHPVLNTWGNVLGAVPFAVASAPLAAAAGSGMAALGDAVAATSAGQAITAGLAPLATAASTSIAGAPLYTWADVGLSSLFGGHGIQTAINEGGISPTTALEIAPLGRLAKPMWDAGKEGLQYAAKAADNATRYMSPSYDLYRTIGETPVSRGSLQKSLTEDFGIFEGPKRVTFFDTPYRQHIDDFFNLVKESTEAPKQYGMRFAGKYGNSPEVLGEDGRWYGNIVYYKNKKFSDPIDNSIIVGKESKYQPEDYLFHYDMRNYPIYYNTDGTPMLHRLPDRTGDLGPIWWNKNSKWGDKSITTPRLIKAPDYGKYRQAISGDNIGDSEAILTGDYPLKDAEFLERDNLVGTMRRGIFAKQPTPKTIETPTIEWTDAAKPPQITSENAAGITPEQWTTAQDAAIAKSDMAEARRLRDLHFKVNAPNTKITDSVWHGSKVKGFNTFDLKYFGRTDGGVDGYGHYFGTKRHATGYKNPREFYLNMENPYTGNHAQFFNREEYFKDNELYGRIPRRADAIRYKKGMEQYKQELLNKDGVIDTNQLWGDLGPVYLVPRSNQMKLADAVTYDDKGVRIPLGLRDNFKSNDIRWGLVPFGVGLTGYGLLKNQKTSTTHKAD